MKSMIKKMIPSQLISAYHYCLALLGSVIYRFPARKLEVIGVTGTNGKTTVVHLISEILERSGHKTASISSARFKIGREEWLNKLHMTMPGRFLIQRFLRQAVNQGCTHAVLEITSEGIKQHRHRFIPFKGAVLTNISPEHIEAHGSFANYKSVKRRLFKEVEKNKRRGSFLVVNLDDPSAKDFSKFTVSQKFGFMVDSKKKCPLTNIRCFAAYKIKTAPRISFQIPNFQDAVFESPLQGIFNTANILAAICAGSAEGIRLGTMQAAIRDYLMVPGRMEIAALKPFRVVIDLAHTPVALEQVYQTLGSNGKKPLICVFGAAGGGRDKWKRPILGQIAAQYCKKIILTNEDPYDEDQENIIAEIAQGAAKQGKKPEIILDRAQAIRRALDIAKKGDTIVITGKGTEATMIFANNKRVPWDERAVVKEALEEIKKKKVKTKNTK